MVSRVWYATVYVGDFAAGDGFLREHARTQATKKGR